MFLLIGARKQFLKSALLLLVLLLSEQGICQRASLPADIQYLFREGGGKDVYYTGDRYGLEIQVLFSGIYKKYTIYYKSESILEHTGYLSKEQSDSLKYYFQKMDFLHLPDVLPRTNKIRWPSRTFTIGYRSSQGDSMKVVSVLLGGEAKDYPEGLVPFISKIKKILLAGQKEQKQ